MSEHDEPHWPIPKSAYIHVPFCRHRCGYCNFSVLAGRDEDYADSFLQALSCELAMLESPRHVDTIFIGGGTPTHLPAPWLRRLLELVTRWFPVSASCEFSVEANPRDIDADRLDVLRSYGVNRLSLGVQSFNQDALRVLERDHSPQLAAAAITHAANTIPNVSIDLIFGSPGQSLAAWKSDLQTARELPLKHISTYGLTYEKGTSFWNRMRHGELSPVPEELDLALYQESQQSLTQGGFEHYEVSNYAMPGYRCRHNAAYWRGDGWYALGPGAASFVNGVREVNHRSPTTYIRKLLAGDSVTIESEPLSVEDWAREKLVFGLRMIEGVELEEIRRATGVDLALLCQAEIDG